MGGEECEVFDYVFKFFNCVLKLFAHGDAFFLLNFVSSILPFNPPFFFRVVKRNLDTSSCRFVLQLNYAFFSSIASLFSSISNLAFGFLTKTNDYKIGLDHSYSVPLCFKSYAKLHHSLPAEHQPSKGFCCFMFFTLQFCLFLRIHRSF